MARDGVVNVVIRLQERGFDPRRVGDDCWEARCPAHRSSDYSLLVARGEFDHVKLECRTVNCPYMRIVSALGFTNEHVYAETPDWLINRLRGVQVQRAAPDSDQRAAPDSDQRAAPDSDQRAAPDSDQRAAPDSDQRAAPDSDQRAAPDSDQRAAPDSDQRAAPDSDRAQANRDDCRCVAEQECGPAGTRPPCAMCRGGETVPAGDGSGACDLPQIGSSCETAAQAGVASALNQELDDLPDLSAPEDASGAEIGGLAGQASPVRVLVSVAAGAKLFRSNDGRFFAQVPVGDRLEIFGLRSAAFRDWLIHGYLMSQPEPPSQVAIGRAAGVLEARARFGADVPEVFVRTGRDKNGEGAAYFIDLGDSTGRAIAIREQGWLMADRPPVYFRRPEGLLPLPLPSRDGSIDLLRPYVNLTEADFRLMLTWLTAVLRPVGPYPILVLHGEQSTAKSTLVKVIRLMIDPHACVALNPPTSTRNLMATAVNGWLLAYDNISDIPRWLSDAFCQLVFGGAISGRAIFTNDDRSFIYAQRPLILSGIGDFVRWDDLKDRCVFLQLPPISPTRRRGEAEFWRAFHADRPRILGAILDAIAGGLRALPSVRLAELPRMADYALWGEAVGRGLGWGAGTFLAGYTDNCKEATMIDLLNSPVANALLQVARVMPEWTGTAAHLHAKLTEFVGKKVATSADWPKTVEKFSHELRRLAPQLRLHGINIGFERRHEGRVVTLKSEQTLNTPSIDECMGAEPHEKRHSSVSVFRL